MKFNILHGDNRDTLNSLADNSIDAIVTDPPYGIDFLGKDWDANTGALETYQECLRVLKPGGYILAFSAAKTYHHLAITLEQAGFEIRDQIMWLYASGFPKAHDIGKMIQKRHGGEQTSPLAQQWAGWKTALKPAHEPICMARKPFKGSCLDNVLTHGVGALNIDATRIGNEEMPIGAHDQTGCLFNPNKKSKMAEETVQGRFPSNVLGEVEGYQKFFYCPKVSRKERHVGFETKDIPTNPDGMYDTAYNQNDEYAGKDYNAVREQSLKVGNNHPTVKPVALMRYLIKLVTPENSVVLDPFCGSGSTGMAAVELDHEFIGCELDPNYVDIATKRITAWNTLEPTGTTYEQLFE